MNGIRNPNVVVVGRRLVVGGSAPAPAPSSTSSSGSTATWAGVPATVVLPGDNLAKISARTGVPVATIMAANRITNPNRLYAGSWLRLAVANGGTVPKLSRCPVSGAHFMNDWGFGRSDTGMHSGNDLMAPRGTPVVAPVSGTVSQVVGTIGGNQFRLVGTDGTVYWGAHLSKFGKAGPVRTGDVIGYVGDTGDAKGGPTHLHFEIHPGNGAAVNPYPSLLAVC